MNKEYHIKMLQDDAEMLLALVRRCLQQDVEFIEDVLNKIYVDIYWRSEYVNKTLVIIGSLRLNADDVVHITKYTLSIDHKLALTYSNKNSFTTLTNFLK